MQGVTMKTNLQIEISDADRQALATLIDGKTSARRVSRKEVINLAQQSIEALILSGIEMAAEIGAESKPEPIIKNCKFDQSEVQYFIELGDRAEMQQPEKPGYVRAWNSVKRYYAAKRQGV